MITQNGKPNGFAYAGIGSRETPRHICEKMTHIAYLLGQGGYKLRSGGARGADIAFERGVENPEMKEIFYKDDICETAIKLAKQFHPNWSGCSSAAKELHSRNVYQILGKDLNSPSLFVICWTPDGSTGETSRATGGTGQAIRIARAKEIPIINLKNIENHSAEEMHQFIIEFVANNY